MAQSSGEAQFIAAAATASEGKFILAIVEACGVAPRLSLYVDSTAAIGTASRRGLARLRHLDVRFLWLQAEVCGKRLSIRKCDGSSNVADANAKPVDGSTLERCRRRMGLDGACVRQVRVARWEVSKVTACLPPERRR